MALFVELEGDIFANLERVESAVVNQCDGDPTMHLYYPSYTGELSFIEIKGADIPKVIAALRSISYELPY